MAGSENSPTRIVAGGLFALLCTFLIAALTEFGFIGVTPGHMFMTAAALVGCIIIWTELIPSKPPKHKLLFSVILCFIVLAADHLMVNHKNAEVGEPVKSTQAARQPDFKLTILGGDIFLPAAHSDWTGFAMDVRIRNAGIPSIAKDWAMTVTTPGGKTWNGQITVPPNKLDLGKAGGILTKGDFLLQALSSRSPMLANDPPVQSRILFYVDKRRDDLLKPDTTIEMSVADFSGKRYRITQRVSDWIQSRNPISNPCPSGGIKVTDSVDIGTDTAFYIKGNPPCPITITRPTIIGGRRGLVVDPSRDKSKQP